MRTLRRNGRRCPARPWREEFSRRAGRAPGANLEGGTVNARSVHSPPSRRAAAWNAAGQCIAAAEFGLTPNYIGVRQVGNGSWWVDIRGRGISASEDDRYRTKRGQAMGLAGDVAEKLAGGDVDLPDNDLCDYVSDLIHRNMLRVHAIAETLAEAAESLEGEELAAILRME